MTDRREVVELLPWQQLCGVCEQLISRPGHGLLMALDELQRTGTQVFDGDNEVWVAENGWPRGENNHWHRP